MTTTVEDMRLDHRRLHILRPQQFLYRPNAIAVFPQVCLYAPGGYALAG